MGTVTGRCVIWGAAPVGPAMLELLRPGDHIIAADGGWVTARSLGVQPHCILGDFDSAPRPDDPDAIVLPTVKDPRLKGCMLSILRCEATNDLRWCKVYISVLGEHDPKELKKGLKSASGFLRSELAHRMTLRYTPELVFVLDDSISYGVHINKLIEDLDIKHDEDEVPEDEDNI